MISAESCKRLLAARVEQNLKLRALLREVIGDKPDRWGYFAAYNVMQDDLRARIREALEETP